MAQPPTGSTDLTGMRGTLSIHADFEDLEALVKSMDLSINFPLLINNYMNLLNRLEQITEAGLAFRTEAAGKIQLLHMTRPRLRRHCGIDWEGLNADEILKSAILEGILHCVKMMDALSTEYATLVEHGCTVSDPTSNLAELAGEVRLEAATWRKDRLFAVCRLVTEKPWLRQFFQNYLWDTPTSSFLQSQAEAGPVVMPVARPDIRDCAVCQIALTEDPDHEGAIPNDGTLPEPAIYVCTTCKQPSHARCTLKWAAFNHARNDCQLCRGPLIRPLLIEGQRREIIRLTIWAENLATILGKPRVVAAVAANQN